MVEAGPGLLTGSSTISTASPSTTNILFTRSNQTESLETNKVLDEWLSRKGREATQVNIFLSLVTCVGPHYFLFLFQTVAVIKIVTTDVPPLVLEKIHSLKKSMRISS